MAREQYEEKITLSKHKQTTIQAINAVSIALSSNTISSYFDTNGYDKISVALMNDAVANNSVDLEWSSDGSTLQGVETILPGATNQRRAVCFDTKARYVRVRIYNNDAATAHTMSAWVYLKA